MAKWSFSAQFTPVAVADALAFTDGGHMTLQGGSATQRIDIYEVLLSGMAAASAPSPMLLARDSVVGGTLTALASPNSNGPLDPSTAPLAAPQVGFIASTTKPNRSNSVSLPKMSMGLNAFGGIIRWNSSPGSEMRMLGNAASNGEVSLSCFTGGTPGLLDAHVLYEPL